MIPLGARRARAPSRRGAPAVRREPLGPLRRLGLQPAPRARPHRGVRPSCCERARMRGWRSSARTARSRARTSRPSCRASGAGDRIRIRSFVPDPELARRVSPGLRVRVPVRVRGIRPAAARGPGVRRSRRSCSTRPWRGRSAGAAARYVARGRRPAVARRAASMLLDEPGRAGRVLTRGRRRPVALLVARGRAPRRWTRSSRCAGSRMADLTIVIVSFNTRAELERAAWRRSRPPRRRCRTAIVVVDNASSDGTPERGPAALARRAAHRLRSQPRVRGGEQPRHPGGGSELVLLLNSDTLVPAGAIDALVRALRVRRRRRGRGPPPGRRRRAARRLSFGRDDGAVQRAAPEGARAALRSPRAGRSVAWVERRVRRRHRSGLGQRRVPAGAARGRRWPRACSTSATSSTRRTWTSAPRCGRAGAASCSRPTREVVHLRGAFAAASARPRPSARTAAARWRSTRNTIRGGPPASLRGVPPSLRRGAQAARRTSREREALWYREPARRDTHVRIAIDVRKLHDFGIGTYIRNLLQSPGAHRPRDRVRPALPAAGP
ncbi:MAG: hypothetical protein MZV64_73020 [Ignavibacteriales bacterium]|nr:hypothetical protein [Ignavibacteriales bacterium]